MIHAPLNKRQINAPKTIAVPYGYFCEKPDVEKSIVYLTPEKNENSHKKIDFINFMESFRNIIIINAITPPISAIYTAVLRTKKLPFRAPIKDRSLTSPAPIPPNRYGIKRMHKPVKNPRSENLNPLKPLKKIFNTYAVTRDGNITALYIFCRLKSVTKHITNTTTNNMSNNIFSLLI